MSSYQFPVRVFIVGGQWKCKAHHIDTLTFRPLYIRFSVSFDEEQQYSSLGMTRFCLKDIISLNILRQGNAYKLNFSLQGRLVRLDVINRVETHCSIELRRSLHRVSSVLPNKGGSWISCWIHCCRIEDVSSNYPVTISGCNRSKTKLCAESLRSDSLISMHCVASICEFYLRKLEMSLSVNDSHAELLVGWSVGVRFEVEVHIRQSAFWQVKHSKKLSRSWTDGYLKLSKHQNGSRRCGRSLADCHSNEVFALVSLHVGVDPLAPGEGGVLDSQDLGDELGWSRQIGWVVAWQRNLACEVDDVALNLILCFAVCDERNTLA